MTDLRPSDYFLRHVRVSSFSYEGPARLRAKSADIYMCCSDFPHSVGTYPNSRRYLAEAFDGIDETMRRTILLENPAYFFGLDLQSDITPTPAVI